MTYTNPFHNPRIHESKPVLSCDREPTPYNGYLIYERHKGTVFDVVKDRVCIAMRAGLNGAKRFIDSVKNGNHE
jgi:hypothetical protein